MIKLEPNKSAAQELKERDEALVKLAQMEDQAPPVAPAHKKKTITLAEWEELERQRKLDSAVRNTPVELGTYTVLRDKHRADKGELFTADEEKAIQEKTAQRDRVRDESQKW